MGPEIVNKGIVVGGKLVRGLYNDSEEEGEGFDQRFAGMSVSESGVVSGRYPAGVATVFVSWSLATSLDSLLEALESYVAADDDLLLESTRFWVCDFVIRQV